MYKPENNRAVSHHTALHTLTIDSHTCTLIDIDRSLLFFKEAFA